MRCNTATHWVALKDTPATYIAVHSSLLAPVSACLALPK